MPSPKKPAPVPATPVESAVAVPPPIDLVTFARLVVAEADRRAIDQVVTILEPGETARLLAAALPRAQARAIDTIRRAAAAQEIALAPQETPPPDHADVGRQLREAAQRCRGWAPGLAAAIEQAAGIFDR